MPDTPLLTLDQAQLVQGPVNMMVSACGPLRRPQVTRGVGCCVSADRRTVSVLVHATAGAKVLDDVRTSGRVAVAFTDPLSNRSLQLKASGVRIEPVGASGAQVARIWAGGYARRIAPRSQPGWSAQNVTAALAPPAEGLVALVFTPEAVFDQTPGPMAGQALAAPAA